MATTIIWMPRAKEHLNKVLNDLYEISPTSSETWTDELDKKLALLGMFQRWADSFQGMNFTFTGRF